jgi:aspartate/methionine/tyrosine aminotransferase
MRRPETFELMHWAKERSERAKLSLGGSGVPSPDPKEVPLLEAVPGDPSPFDSTGNYYGDPRLRDAIAELHGVERESVIVSEGTSLANYTALACLAGPGETILVERPTYASLAAIPRFHGALVRDIVRRPESAWVPSVQELERLIPSERPRAIVLTRLHNPSGCDLPQNFLDALARLADVHDFYVLFDEVYLDFLEGASPAHRFSRRFLTTGSLTKAYGFGGLRVGWIVGDDEILEPMKELSFHLAVNGSTSSQSAALRVLQHRDEILARSRRISQRGLSILASWIETRDDVKWTPPAGGLTAFLQLASVSNTMDFSQSLYHRHGVAAPPGELFGMPGWVRVSVGAAEEKLRDALDRLGKALDAWGRERS